MTFIVKSYVIIIVSHRHCTSNFVTETFEDVEILLWLLHHLHSLLSHLQHCAEHVKMVFPEIFEYM